MKLSTVNVIETIHESFISLASYSDDAAGNRTAERRFRKCAVDNGAMPDEVDDYLEDGRYVMGDYELSIVHSTEPVRGSKR